MCGLVKPKSGGAEDCDKRRGLAAQPEPRGAAGPVRRAGGGGRGGGGGSGAAATGGAERRVDGVRHASVDLSPLFYRYVPFGTTIDCAKWVLRFW